MEVLSFNCLECPNLGRTIKYNICVFLQKIDITHDVIDPRLTFGFDDEAVSALLSKFCQEWCCYASSLKNVV